MQYLNALEKLGVASLRESQSGPIRAILAGLDTLCTMPTGGGKSLIFQLTALELAPKLTVVVSPLKALQADQVQRLCDKAVPARALNSSLPAAERNQILQEVMNGTLTLLYIAPEQLLNTEVRAVLDGADVSQVAVDEAHMLARDQDGFRTAYAEIGA